MKSKQLENPQLKFKTLNGQIQIDETFIKEIHKDKFKDKFDKKNHLDPFSTNTKCCIQIAALILSKTLDIYKKPWFYWLFNKLIFLQKHIFYKVF